jgi:hypothetical protein
VPGGCLNIRPNDIHHHDTQYKILNGEESHLNKTLDGCMYTGHKLVQLITVSEKHIVNRTHLLKPGIGAGPLVSDRASL